MSIISGVLISSETFVQDVVSKMLYLIRQYRSVMLLSDDTRGKANNCHLICLHVTKLIHCSMSQSIHVAEVVIEHVRNVKGN